MQGEKYDIIDEKEEFNEEEKIKIAQLALLYKNNNNGGQKHGNEKSPGKTKYGQKNSPPKNHYHTNKNLYLKNNFQLPVIPKGTVYNHGGFIHKKYNFY